MNCTTITYPFYSKKRNLDASNNLNLFHCLWSPPRTRSKVRRCERNVFDAARAFSEDVLKSRLSITSNQDLVISNRK
jgi:hypothetical protein